MAALISEALGLRSTMSGGGGGAAKNSKVGKVQPKVYDHQTVFLCMPLRTATVLIGASSFLLGVSLLLDRIGTEESLRPFIGGYVRKTRTLIGIVDLLGLVFGPLAIAGALGNKRGHVRLFVGFQAARLLTWLWMFLVDLPQLWACELWTTNVAKAQKLYSWNPVMFNVAVQSHCHSERVWFLVCSIPSFLFAIYCLNVTQKLLADMEEDPPYLFKTPLGTTNGAFYTRSWASQSIHEQMAEQAKHAAHSDRVRLHLQDAQLAKQLGLNEDQVALSGWSSSLPAAPAAKLAADDLEASGAGARLPHFGAGATPAFAESAPAGMFRPAAADGQLEGAFAAGPLPRPPWSSDPGPPPASEWVHEAL